MKMRSRTPCANCGNRKLTVLARSRESDTKGTVTVRYALACDCGTKMMGYTLRARPEQVVLYDQKVPT